MVPESRADAWEHLTAEHRTRRSRGGSLQVVSQNDSSTREDESVHRSSLRAGFLRLLRHAAAQGSSNCLAAPHQAVN